MCPNDGAAKNLEKLQLYAKITRQVSLFFQGSGEAMSEEEVKHYIAANEFAQRRHHTTTAGRGAELEIFPWFDSPSVLLFLQPSC